jgi:hypothetical protein
MAPHNYDGNFDRNTVSGSCACSANKAEDLPKNFAMLNFLGSIPAATHQPDAAAPSRAEVGGVVVAQRQKVISRMQSYGLFAGTAAGYAYERAAEESRIAFRKARPISRMISYR